MKSQTKKLSVSSLKKAAWVEFSKYIRQREVDEFGYAQCVTCGKRYHWKQLQAGHFIPGRHNSILFDERGCHQQCYSCNCGWLKGNPRKYDAFMRQRYGEEVIKELEALDRKDKQFTPNELIELREKFKALSDKKYDIPRKTLS